MTRRIALAAVAGLAILAAPQVLADEKTLSEQLESATSKVVDQQKYQLQYQFAADETLRWKVAHLVTVETKISGNSQVAKTRSTSQKVWQVADVKEQTGDIVYLIDWVDMWQSVTGREEIRFDSRNGSPPPPEYETVAKTIGHPLAKVTLNRQGEVVDRDNLQSLFNSPGLGDFAVRLPAEAVGIGSVWSDDEIVPIRIPPENVVKQIKIRRQYRLEKVKFGVATISVTTQVLTPVHDAKVKSQLIQRMTKGEVKFDVDAGRIISKRLELDERVIGFNGADSVMHYLARFTEELIDDEAAAERVAEKPE